MQDRSLHRITIAVLFAAAAAIAVPACMTTRSHSSFSQNLQTVYTTTGDTVIWADRDPDRIFDRLLVQPLQFRVFSPARFGMASPNVERELVLAYDEVMQEVLASSYPFVNSPGPTTLRVSAALTDRVSVPQLKEKSDWVQAGSGGQLGTLVLEMIFYEGKDEEPFAALLSRRYSPVYIANLQNPDRRSLRSTFAPTAMQLKDALDTARNR